MITQASSEPFHMYRIVIEMRHAGVNNYDALILKFRLGKHNSL